MKITTKVRYGVRAIAQIAFNYEKQIAKREEIVGEQEISNSYLENILVTLRAGGLILTKRGPTGGYTLSRSPSKITLLDVYNALEGEIVLVDCVKNPLSCKRIKGCQTTKIWKNLSRQIQDFLGNITLNDLRTNPAALKVPKKNQGKIQR
jgi:Rrf2 family protein